LEKKFPNKIFNKLKKEKIKSLARTFQYYNSRTKKLSHKNIKFEKRNAFGKKSLEK